MLTKSGKDVIVPIFRKHAAEIGRVFADATPKELQILEGGVRCSMGSTTSYGRITPGLLEQLGLLGRIGEVAGQIPGGGGEFHLIVLQHTDCGITRLTGDPDKLARYFQIQQGELKAKAVTEPHAAVAIDVAALRAIPALPAAWLISGLVYDVTTGLVEVVVPPAPIRNAGVSDAA